MQRYMCRTLRTVASTLLSASMLCCFTSQVKAQGVETQEHEMVGVSGTHFTLDGKKWLPRCVTLQAFVAPPAYLQKHRPDAYRARINYGPKEFDAARKFGVDTLRLQVSQAALDPDPRNSHYDARYVADFIAGVKLARQYGFVVIIMMQDETNVTGVSPQYPLATEATVRDWDELNPAFHEDRGVIYELYNEPELPANSKNWSRWAYGDNNSVPKFVGMEPLIAHLRMQGSLNTFIVNGLSYAGTLEGVPVLHDRLNQVVYAVHPYPRGQDAAHSNWDNRFGNVSQQLPVFADEWSAESGTSLGLGKLPDYQAAVHFLNYLRSHEIPLGAGAFDMPGLMVQGVPGWIPTNYDHYSPNNQKDNAGLLVRTDFLADYTKKLTDTDGVTH